jgi:hypothetical protein
MERESKIIDCIHDRLKDMSDNEGKLERGKLITTLGLIYRFPKEARPEIIKELESKGVLIIISKFEVKIN